MTTTTASPELRLTQPPVESSYVSAEFSLSVAAQLELAKAFMIGETDQIPVGFTQPKDAHLPYHENERDYYIEQFSQAFAADPHVFDKHMNDFELRNAEHNLAQGAVQPPWSQANAVTMNLRPFMQERLGVVDTTKTMVVQGCMIRGVELPGSEPGRGLDLFEVEVPVADASGNTSMARLVYFVKK